MFPLPPDLPGPLQPAQPNPPHLAELDRLGDQIAELSAHLEAATARLLALIREFDAREGWANGFRSCAEWLAWRVGLAPGAAREQVRVARALGTLPALAEALARGELSYAKVRALTRIATPETEARLLAVGRAGTAVHVESIVRGWRRLDQQAEAREATRQHAGRALHVYQDQDGTVVLRGRLTPEAGALLLRALDAARETLYQRRRASDAAVPATDPAIGGPDPPAAAGRRPGPAGRDGPASRARPGGAGRTVSGGCPRGRGSPGGCGPARAIGAGRRRARSRGNVAAAGVRREPGGDAARCGRAGGGSRRPNADDPAGVTAGAAASGQDLPLPGL